MTFSGCGFGTVAELADSQVFEARLACVGMFVRNCRDNKKIGPFSIGLELEELQRVVVSQNGRFLSHVNTGHVCRTVS